MGVASVVRIRSSRSAVKAKIVERWCPTERAGLPSTWPAVVEHEVRPGLREGRGLAGGGGEPVGDGLREGEGAQPGRRLDPGRERRPGRHGGGLVGEGGDPDGDHHPLEGVEVGRPEHGLTARRLQRGTQGGVHRRRAFGARGDPHPAGVLLAALLGDVRQKGREDLAGRPDLPAAGRLLGRGLLELGGARTTGQLGARGPGRNAGYDGADQRESGRHHQGRPGSRLAHLPDPNAPGRGTSAVPSA